jgi:hypothetical protein
VIEEVAQAQAFAERVVIGCMLWVARRMGRRSCLVGKGQPLMDAFVRSAGREVGAAQFDLPLLATT